MPLAARFCPACLLPTDSSMLSCVPTRSSSSIKSILHRRISKKCSVNGQDRNQQKLSIRKFQRIKGSNILREIILCNKSQSTSKKTHSYDMTILHDDELNNTELAMIHRRKKKIPSWAQKDQLQLAIINQVYFQDKNPDDIFGSICIDRVFEMINSMNIKNKESMPMIVSRHV